MRSSSSQSARLYFGVLGPVQLLDGARPVSLGGPGMRGLLAALLLRPNEVVPIDEIIDRLWAAELPDTARTIVHGYVSGLRRKLTQAIPADDQVGARILTRAPGYELVVDPDRIDLHLARGMLDRAQSAPAAERAELIGAALALWRGPALADLPAHARAPELDELRLAMQEQRIAAELELGRGQQLVTELRQLTRTHPFREQSHGLLLRALYHSGRRSDALEEYQRFARRARAERGIDPGHPLRELHERILRDELDRPTAEQEAAITPRIGVVKPAQLPAPMPGFAGRAAELDWLAGLPSAASTVGVVSGIAGVGKTALVVNWAWQAAARYPDGQLFARMHGFTPDREPVAAQEVLGQFLRALGVPAEDIPEDQDDRVALYRSLLAERSVLVVLDDVRESAQVRPLLPTGPSSLTVVTSRVRLDGLVARDMAQLYPLEPLPVHDAIRLLGNLSEVDNVGLVGAELAKLCDYLPLALRIVAARLASGRGQRAAELVTELSEESARLAGLAVEGMDASIAAALEVSYRGLDPGLARLFQVLGCLPGVTISAPALAAAAGLPISTVTALLPGLVLHNLIAPIGEAHFGMHDLVRLYAREVATIELAATERTQVLGNVLGYYLAAADTARRQLRPPTDPLTEADRVNQLTLPELGSQDSALGWFEAEWANLHAVLAAGAAEGFGAEVWRLARYAHTFRAIRAQRDDWQAILRTGLNAARAAGDPEGEGWMLVSMGVLLSRFARADEILPLAERILEISVDDRLSLAGASLLASGWYGQRRHVEAISGYRQALRHARRLGDQVAEANQLNNVAQVQRELGERTEAIETQRAAFELYRLIGDRGFEVFALANLAELYGEVGQLDAAEEHARQALELAVERGVVLGAAFAREVLGRALRDRGQLAAARDELELSVDGYQRADAPGAATARAALAEVLDRLAEREKRS
ncbi:DNA-binding SARP family transcriptional activator [Tamaricihabitans halophyticus]|uniref:DNA-binding SARP family transcriptional activator n=1 Tax=Tamaricihabitans halophyticus TaxID=1262583 RepID=A0A4R2RB25_9PSEU|nr:BTAD domain-containing putative transcriptional regulator [Tamaricihabitans halophyticus]TCP56625.1 DNA-binding SARP family transcriptional activator [Tamaricihabitans halophyticus]